VELPVNNHLFEYMVLSHMQLQNDMLEMKASMVECHSRYMHLVKVSAMSASAARSPKTISHGYAALVDATGREHTILLDHCRSFDQLDSMLSVILFECRPDEAEIHRWYITHGIMKMTGNFRLQCKWLDCRLRK